MNLPSKILKLAGLFLSMASSVFSQVNPTWDTLYYYKSATSGIPQFVNPALNGTPLTRSSYGWINTTPCITGFSGFGISPAQNTFNPSTNPYVELNLEPTDPSYSFKVEKFSVDLRSSSIGANFVMMAYSLNNGVSWVSKGLPDSPNISATCGVTVSRNWTLSSPLMIGGGFLTPNIKVRLYYFHSLGFIGGSNQVLNFIVHGKINYPVDYYSVSSGNMSDAIWSPSPNGIIGQRVYFTPETNATIQAGHSVNANRRETPFQNLTIQSGGQLQANSSNLINLNCISIFQNLVVDGIIGNALSYDAIGIQAEGPNVILSGNGAIHPGKIRKQYSINAVSNIQLQSPSLTLHYPGAAIYNSASNTNFNIFISAGTTVRVTGSGAVPGSVSIDGPTESDIAQKGGRLDVSGELIVNGKLSIASSNNNGLFPCLFNVQPSGSVFLNELVVRNNGINLTTFSAGSSVTVSGVMKHLDGLLNTQNALNFLAGASLLHGSSTPAVLPFSGGQLTGNIKFQANGSEAIGVYNYWSSPVTNSPLSVINANGTSAGSTYNTYHYDANFATSTTVQGLRQGWVHLSPSDLMQAGRGYITTTAGSVLFNGPANDGTIFISPIEGQFTRFNLVGNPYPGPISANQFIIENQGAAIFPALYFWDDDASLGQDFSVSDYIVSNAVGTVATGGNTAAGQFAGRIAAGQSFFVEAKPSGANIRFSNSMRTSGPTTFFEDSVLFSKYWIRLSGESAASETLIAFGDQATDGYDEQFDAKNFSVNSVISLGSQIEDNSYSIQAKPIIQNSSSVFLSVSSLESGNFTFQLVNSQNNDPSVIVFLYDHLENQTVCLSNQTYTVFLTANTSSSNRFELRFSAPVSHNVSSANCQGNGGGVHLQSNEIGWSYQVIGDAVSVPVSGLIQDNTSVFLTEGVYTLTLTNLLSSIQLDYSIVIPSLVAAEGELQISNDTIVSGEPVTFLINSQQNLEVFWSLDGTLVAEGMILENMIFNQSGIHTLTIQMTNESCTSTIFKEIFVHENLSLTTKQIKDSRLSLFPNPANSFLNILLPERYSLKSGKLILRNQVSSECMEFYFTDREISINTLDFPNGIYWVQVMDNESSHTKKLVIIH